MKKITILVFATLFALFVLNSKVDAQDSNSISSSFFGSDVNLNFLNNAGVFSNLAPTINYGWREKITGLGNNKNTLFLKALPYVSAQPDVKDTNSMLPALMLPGRFGLNLSPEFNFEFTGGHTIIFTPIGFGLKFLSNYTDSLTTLVQHSINSSFEYSWDDKISLGATYTWSWYDLTSSAENNFKKSFGTGLKDLRYISAYLSVKCNKSTDNKNPFYINLEWRYFLDNDYYNLPNSKILTLSFTKSFDLGKSLIGSTPTARSTNKNKSTLFQRTNKY